MTESGEVTSITLLFPRNRLDSVADELEAVYGAPLMLCAGGLVSGRVWRTDIDVHLQYWGLRDFVTLVYEKAKADSYYANDCSSDERDGRDRLAEPDLRKDLLGCYALFSGDRALDSTYFNASPLVRLDGTAGWRRTAHAARFRMLRLDAGRRRLDSRLRQATRDFSWWVDPATDTLELSFSDGFSGTYVKLAARAGADTLYGRIAEWWDAGPTNTKPGPARAVRTTCGDG